MTEHSDTSTTSRWARGVWAATRRAVLGFAPSKTSVLAASGLASVAVCALAGVSLATSHVTVSVEVDGVTRPYSNFATSVGSVLSDIGVEVSPADHVAPALTDRVYDGSKIVVRHAHPVDVDINGKVTTIHTTAGSLVDVLSALASRGDVHAAANRSVTREEILPLVTHPQNVDVVMGEQTFQIFVRPGDSIRGLIAQAGHQISAVDRVVANMSNGALQIVVEKVTRGATALTEPVAFTERAQDNPDLFRGESVITTKGVAGVTTKNLWQEKVNGHVTHETLVSAAVTTAPVDQIRSNGTKEATPAELMKAGLDPKATLEEGVEEDGTPSIRYRAKLGTISSTSEIAQIRRELGLTPGAPLPGEAARPAVYSGEDPRGIAQGMVAARGWSDSEFQCLVSLWQRESNWNPYAENPSSGAYGIPQSLPGSKMASAGDDWRTNPVTQITWGLGYIANRYGSPCGAWAHSEAVGWY